MYPIHKQTDRGPEIALYYFFKFQRLVRKLQFFECFVVEYISFSTGPVPNRYDYNMRFSVILWVTYESLMVQLTELVRSGEMNQR